MVDPLRLSALLDRVGAESAALRRLAQRSDEDLLADPDVLAGVKYRFVRDTARFRNLLVHGYAAVDDRRVVEILHTRAGDLDRYREALARTAAADPAHGGT